MAVYERFATGECIRNDEDTAVSTTSAAQGWKIELKTAHGWLVRRYGRDKVKLAKALAKLERKQPGSYRLRKCGTSSRFQGPSDMAVPSTDFNLAGEVFTALPGYEGYYSVSNLGRVFGMKSGSILSSCKDNRGFRVVGLHARGKFRQLRLHRLVAKAFVPNPENLPNVAFKDRNKDHCAASNLAWSGWDNGWTKVTNAKLGACDVRRIAQMVRDGARQHDVALLFGVSVSTVNKIHTGKQWKHLQSPVAASGLKA